MSKFGKMLSDCLDKLDSYSKEFNQYPYCSDTDKACAEYIATREKLEERDRKLLEALKEIASYGGSWETLVKNVFKDIGEEY